MKSDWSHLELFRVAHPRLPSTYPGDRHGCFFVPRGTARLRCIVSDGTDPDSAGWEHVSISVLDNKGTRIPTWSEMCMAKDLFWDAEECVVQFHPPKSDYVNQHPHTLHLWKNSLVDFPRPPSILVGIKT